MVGMPFVDSVWVAITFMASQVSREVGIIWKSLSGIAGNVAKCFRSGNLAAFFNELLKSFRNDYLTFGEKKAVPNLIFGP